MEFIIEKGNIVTYAVDGIVNASDNHLSGGGGVDKAIHEGAGKQLRPALNQFKTCPTGKVIITPGFNLPTKYILHTAGPIWQGGNANEAQLLASCYFQAIKRADQMKLQSLAFSSISTGIYAYPVDQAAYVAVQTIHDTLKECTHLQKVIMVCFNQRTLTAYVNAKNKIIK